MTPKSKTILLSSVIAAAVAVIMAVSLVFVLLPQESLTSHILANGVKLTLVREKLTYNALSESGFFLPATDDEKKDFSKPTQENIFGITPDTKVIPGCMYDVQMTVASAKASQGFAYWLEIRLLSERNELSDALVITVSAEGGEGKKFRLSESPYLGTQEAPIALVTEGSSTFELKLEFSKQNDLNGAQGKPLSFDLIVHAVPYQPAEA